ncbi:MAG: ribonuclease T [Epsilonproteobacteria bacterium]|nr:ribonuclease T [Campylobacterota bacterium]
MSILILSSAIFANNGFFSFLNRNNEYKNRAVLSMSMQNVFCQMHTNKKECQIDNKKILTLHGLWPQPANRQYCNVNKKIIGADKNHQWYRLPDVKMDHRTKEELVTVMPGVISELHKHEWYKHGTCSNLDSDEYFTRSISYFKQFENSKAGRLIYSKRGSMLYIDELRKSFDESFGNESSKKVEMICKNGKVTEIRINLGNYFENNLKNAVTNGMNVKKSCKSGMVI